MSVNHSDPAMCTALRPNLEAFAHDRLGPADRAELLRHMLVCTSCADACTSILTARLESGQEPLVTPNSTAPRELYDRYLAARRPEPGSKKTR